MRTTEHFHETPRDLYDRLAALFGESRPREQANDTRWVEFGAGSVDLCFFPVRVYDQDTSDDDAEPFVRDPEAWQAVAAEGRKYR